MYSRTWLNAVAGPEDAQAAVDADEWVNQIMRSSIHTPSFIHGKTPTSIRDQVNAALDQGLSGTSATPARLIDGQYHLVSSTTELMPGRFIRWIVSPGTPTAKLTNGGLVTGLTVSRVDASIHVRWKSAGIRKRIGIFRFDSCTVFQKLSNDEQLALIVSSNNALRAKTRPPLANVTTSINWANSDSSSSSDDSDDDSSDDDSSDDSDDDSSDSD